jgi:hypothetical protein
MVDSSNVVQIGEAQGSFLLRVDLYRKPDGEIHAVLQDMPDHVIESETDICSRMLKAAGWAIEGGLSLMRQGIRFDEEIRNAQWDSVDK